MLPLGFPSLHRLLVGALFAAHAFVASAQTPTAYVMGSNSLGQLGLVTSPSVSAPVLLGADVVAVTAGIGHTLYLKVDGTLWATGGNAYGQLGTGDTVARTTPVQIATGVASASAGSFHSLFVKIDGTLWATGLNDRGQLGTGSTTSLATPAQIATSVKAVSAGAGHTLLLKTDGTLWGMGDNSCNQITPYGSTSIPITAVTSIASGGVSACAAGGYHSLWVKSHTLYAIGDNHYGQLGVFTSPDQSTLRNVTSIATDVSTVATGYGHSLFIKTDGSLWAMGRNTVGQLGDGSTTNRSSPVPIATAVTGIAVGGLGLGAGNGHSLFLKTDGSLWAMGDNRFGQLGDGTRLDRVTPVPVSGAAYVTAIAAGDLHSAFIQSPPVAPTIATPPLTQTLTRGDYAQLQVMATGGFLSYQWFRGASGDTSQPVVGATSAYLNTLPVTAPVSFWVRVSNPVGTVDSATAQITASAPLAARVSVFGQRTAGEQGESVIPFVCAVPFPLTDVADIASGKSFGLILKRDGTLWSVDLTAPIPTGAAPVQIATSVTAISAGSDHVLFLKADHTLWGFGLNTSGQLGLGDLTNRSVPTLLASDVSAIAAGGAHSLFLTLDGTLRGMGSNTLGQLGDNTTTDSPAPITIATGIVAIAAGANHTLFVGVDGVLRATGQNLSGQLGLGDLTNRQTPTEVATGVRSVASHAGAWHSLFLGANGTLYGMGDNSSGQLGLGDTTNRLSPVRLADGVRAVAAGTAHTAWVRDDDTLWTTGRNNSGQLGLGTDVNQTQPVEIAGRVERVAAGAENTFFTTRSGESFGLGKNRDGRLGVAPVSAFRSAAQVLADGVSAVDARPYASWTLGASGALWSSFGLPTDGLPISQVIASDAVRLAPSNVFFPQVGTAETTSVQKVNLFIRADGSLWGCGDNATGQLGTGDVLSRSAPVRIADEACDVGVSWNFALFLKPDLSVWKTGTITNSSPSTYTPAPTDLVPQPLDHDVVSIKVGMRHALYLKTDGTLWGVGDTSYAQLGFVGGAFSGPAQTTPVMVATEVVSYAVTQRNSYFIKRDGTLWGCGLNGFGMLGSVSGSYITPRQIATGTSSLQTATGISSVVGVAQNVFFLKTDGSLWAFGDNTRGQLGGAGPIDNGVVWIAGPNSRLLPSNPLRVPVARFFPAATGENTFFIRTDDSLWGMGRNDQGQLGLGHTNTVGIATLLRAQAYAVAASGLHTLVLHAPDATLTPPAITTSPVSRATAFGEPVTLSVAATGDGVLAYRWYRGLVGDTSRPVAAGDATTLTVPAFAPTATYWARVSNAVGSADSAAATITVAASGTPAFRAWAEAAGLSGSRLATTADPDTDGQPNLLEYAFRSAPGSATDTTPVELVSGRDTDGGFLVLTHPHAKAADVNFTYQRSPDLLTWETVPLTPVVTDPDVAGDGQVEAISVTVPLAPETPRLFLRVQVSEP